ncbi:MAG: hypothetical protein Q4D96_10780 [Propionibacteriaceae bacterium]|nr:hypothetical protein [Propionibacteriaceae bacterium]
MKVGTEELKDWPDPAAMFDASASLAAEGSAYYEAVGAARNIWRELSAHYWTDGAELLYSALNHPADVSAQIVFDCTVTVSAALTLFADELTKLRQENIALQEEVEAYNNKPAADEPGQGPGADEEIRATYLKGVELQNRVADLVRRYEEAISNCVNRLCAVGDDGSPDPGSAYWSGIPESLLKSAFAAVAQGAQIDTTRTTVRVFHWDGTEMHELRPRFEYNRSLSIDWWGILEGKGVSPEGLLERFNKAVEEGHSGPLSNSNYWPSRPDEAPDVAHGAKPPSRVTMPGQPEPVRGGRIRFGGIIGLVSLGFEAFDLYQEEYAQADRRFQEEHPEMSGADRRRSSMDAAVVRTGAQLAAAEALDYPLGNISTIGGAKVGAYAGAWFGPAGILVGAAGGAVLGSWMNGQAVGVIMDADTGENKDVGDRVGDVAEAAFDALFNNGGR